MRQVSPVEIGRGSMEPSFSAGGRSREIREFFATGTSVQTDGAAARLMSPYFVPSQKAVSDRRSKSSDASIADSFGDKAIGAHGADEAQHAVFCTEAQSRVDSRHGSAWEVVAELSRFRSYPIQASTLQPEGRPECPQRRVNTEISQNHCRKLRVARLNLTRKGRSSTQNGAILV